MQKGVHENTIKKKKYCKDNKLFLIESAEHFLMKAYKSTANDCAKQSAEQMLNWSNIFSN